MKRIFIPICIDSVLLKCSFKTHRTILIQKHQKTIEDHPRLLDLKKGP
jgi:hypothetical protein